MCTSCDQKEAMEHLVVCEQLVGNSLHQNKASVCKSLEHLQPGNVYHRQGRALQDTLGKQRQQNLTAHKSAETHHSSPYPASFSLALFTSSAWVAAESRAKPGVCFELEVPTEPSFLKAPSQPSLPLLLLPVLGTATGTGVETQLLRQIQWKSMCVFKSSRDWGGGWDEGTDGWHHCISLIPLPKTNTKKQSNCQRFTSVKLQDKLIQDRAGEGAGRRRNLLKGWAQWAMISGKSHHHPEVPANLSDSVKYLLEMSQGWSAGKPTATEQTPP